MYIWSMAGKGLNANMKLFSWSFIGGYLIKPVHGFNNAKSICFVVSEINGWRK